MEETQVTAQNMIHYGADPFGRLTAGRQLGLARLDIPIAIGIPEKFIEQGRRLVEMELVQSPPVTRVHRVKGNEQGDRIRREVLLLQ